MWRFGKSEGISDSGALFGAAVFATSGLAASLSAFWNHFGAWAWIPAIAWIARSGLKTRGALLALALFVGLQAMAGSPEVSALTAVVAIALSLHPRPEVERPWLEPSRRRTVLRTTGAILLGFAVAGWVLVPMGELAAHSDRRGSLPAVEREPGAISIPAVASGLTRPNGSARTYWLASLFVGPLALAVGLAAFFERERRVLAGILLALGMIGVLVAAAGPPGSWLRAIPPLDRIRYPEKALVLVSFAAGVLGALGLDALRFRAGGAALRLGFPVIAAGALLVALGGSFPAPLSAATAFGLLAASALALGAGRRENAGAALGALASLALVAGYAVASRDLFRFVPEAEIRRRPAALDAVGNLAGRVLTPPPQALAGWTVRDWTFGSETIARQREALAGYTNLLFGIPTVRTASALPTAGARSIAESIDAARNPVRAAGPASARVLWSPFRPGPLPSRAVGGFFRAPIAPYRPRLSFARSYRVEPDAERAWSRAASGDVDVAREVLLDREPSPRPPAGARSPILLARLAEDRPERVVAEVTTNSAGLLVVTDLFYPGWIAEEGGRRLDMLRADGLFRAVALPAGTHRVTFRYRPRSVYAGAAVSGAALLAILVLAFQGEPVRLGRRG
jgi:hypothetical protein